MLVRSHFLAVTAAMLLMAAGVPLAAQEKYSLVSPSGISFSEVRGYELWQMVAPSQADDASGCSAAPGPGCIKVILGNPTTIDAYADGIPSDGRPVPDGAMFAKIEWKKAQDFGMTVAGDLSGVAFMLKDGKRFPKTDGWGYAAFRYDAASDTWIAAGDRPEFVEACHTCHTTVKARDFVWTKYPKR
jgi:hypothetical protein